MRPRSLTLNTNINRVNRVIEVVQITDLHLLPDPDRTLLGVNTEDSFRKVVDLARSQFWPPDVILLSGDLTQDPLAATYRRLDRFLRSLGVPCVCLPGNHDDPRIMRDELTSRNVYCSSQIVSDSWQIICLDSTRPGSESGHLSAENFRILEDHLDQYPEKFALICLHHHPLPIGSAWMDTMVVDNGTRFFDVLESHSRIGAVVCGHIHQAFATRFRNLQVLGTPSTCFQFKPGSDRFTLDDLAPGYRRLSLYPDGHFETAVFRSEERPNGVKLRSEGYPK